MLTSESSVNRSTHVVRDLQTNRLRLLTPIEAERLNGFEDNWTNSGMPEKFRYFCMGNALVVNLVEKMGKSIKQIIEKEDCSNIKEDIIDKENVEIKILDCCKEILEKFDDIAKITNEVEFNKILDIVKYHQINVLNLSKEDRIMKMDRDIQVLLNNNNDINDEVAITK